MSERNANQGSEDSKGSGRNRLAGIAAGAAISLISVVIALVIAEAGFRLATGVPVFAADDWRVKNLGTKRIGDRAKLDPRLGWTLKENYQSPGFNTIGLGIRQNFDETEVRTGGILAVGDSFTEGFEEVVDSGTWPAHLEKMLGVPVINGGVAGYAVDQIALRAEQLLPVIQPNVVIFGMTDADFYRTALSDSGAPKPWYTIENDRLVYHPPGPPVLEPKIHPVGSAIRGVLGYSALGDHLLSRLAPSFWYPKQAETYQEADNDPLEVICRLLRRTKAATEEASIRLILFLQHAGEIVAEEPEIIQDMKAVTQCAQTAGIQVVDQFAPLRALTQGDPDKVAEYYVVTDDEFGHMSSKGNQHAARLLAQALSDDYAPVNAALEGAPSNPVAN